MKKNITTMRGVKMTANNIKRNVEQILDRLNDGMPESMKYRVTLEEFGKKSVHIVIGSDDDFISGSMFMWVKEALKRWTDKTDSVFMGIGARERYIEKYDFKLATPVIEITVIQKEEK